MLEPNLVVYTTQAMILEINLCCPNQTAMQRKESCCRINEVKFMTIYEQMEQ